MDIFNLPFLLHFSVDAAVLFAAFFLGADEPIAVGFRFSLFSNFFRDGSAVVMALAIYSSDFPLYI